MLWNHNCTEYACPLTYEVLSKELHKSCHSPGDQLPVSHCRGPGSIPWQAVRELGWARWQGQSSFQVLRFFSINTVPQMYHTHISCMTSETIKSWQLTAPLNNALKSFIQLAVPISSGIMLQHWPKHRRLWTARNDRMFSTTIILWHKCKVVSAHAMKLHGRGGTAPCILNLGAVLGSVVSSTAWPLYPWRNNLRYPLKKVLGGLQSWSGCFGAQIQILIQPRTEWFLWHCLLVYVELYKQLEE